MEQKTNKWGCCPCCGKPSHGWLFKEQHEAEWKRQMELNRFFPDEVYFGGTQGKFLDSLDSTKTHREPKPLPLIEWEQSNPRPEMSMMEFVIQLNNRVATLEAQMLQKRGAK